jgi:TRAP-type transport system small permease protein
MLRLLDRSIEALLTAILAVLVAIAGAQVVWRYLLDSPLSWVLEASIVLMVWATMLAGYVGVRRNSHLSADFLGVSMRAATRWWLDLASLGLCLVFVAVYGWVSLEVIDAMEGIGFPSLPIGQPVLYWSLPTSAALMALALIVRMREHIGRRPPAD